MGLARAGSLRVPILTCVTAGQYGSTHAPYAMHATPTAAMPRIARSAHILRLAGCSDFLIHRTNRRAITPTASTYVATTTARKATMRSCSAGLIGGTSRFLDYLDGTPHFTPADSHPAARRRRSG